MCREKYFSKCIVELNYTEGPGSAAIPLASFLWDIDKQNSPRWDAVKTGRPIWGFSVCLHEFHRKMK